MLIFEHEISKCLNPKNPHANVFYTSLCTACAVNRSGSSGAVYFVERISEAGGYGHLNELKQSRLIIQGPQTKIS